ncbi:SDR family oxidoreductase [Mycolicibacterium septicum DSM 44393]|uniref:SDR family oxidoreductase n=1 Tax=Mycolicibacterium septicum DSM 44393 TaxID=1341646 RepID=A0A7X6MLA5_9MYCO|nr:SDR family oxidoreductase [Mycolicibacterium septicum]NKZ10847.1 SDR family oxidoreductase [Mycolicibacterium septicum DSM 44393]
MSLPPPLPTSTAVVTGASAGIGADIARELASRGYGVTLVARREDRLQELAAELSGTVRVEVIACDVADPTQRATLFDTVADHGLVIDILVNNAGIGTIGAVVDSTVDAEIAQVRVNVEAVIDLTTRAIHEMVPRGRGAILNVGSGSGFIPTPGQAGYAGTKAFTHTYGEGLRGELAGTGVTIATVCPGPVDTEFVAAAGAEADALALPKFMYLTPRQVARIGIDAVAHDRGTVIAGWPTRIATTIARLTPKRLLVSVLARGNPAFSRG